MSDYLPMLPVLFVDLVERNTGYDTGVVSGALGSDLGPAGFLKNGQKVNIILLGGFYSVSV